MTEQHGITSDLTDLAEQGLDDLAEAVRTGDTTAEETLRRVAPSNGTPLLVAASFNSAI